MPPSSSEGIEATLRRLAHYDYWSNKLETFHPSGFPGRPDFYGMGEHSIVEIADALNSGIDIKDTFIDGTVFKTRNLDIVYDYKMLPDYQELKDDKRVYAKSFVQYSNHRSGAWKATG